MQHAIVGQKDDLARFPFWRANAGRWRAERSWVRGGAALVVVAREPAPMLLGVGQPEALAALVASVHPGPVGHVMLTQGTWRHVPPAARTRLGYRPGRSWEWMVTAEAPPVQPGQERVAELTGPDRLERVHACLAQAYPERGRRATDGDLSWWASLLDHAPEPALAGVVGASVPAERAARSGAGVNLQALGVLPRYRRQGVAAAMAAALTRWGLTRGSVVHLGIWSDNDAARRVYTRLGYRTEHHVENLHPPP